MGFCYFTEKKIFLKREKERKKEKRGGKEERKKRKERGKLKNQPNPLLNTHTHRHTQIRYKENIHIYTHPFFFSFCFYTKKKSILNFFLKQRKINVPFLIFISSRSFIDFISYKKVFK